MRKLRIFWKVFLMTISVLGLMIIIAYILLYLLLPDFYKKYKTEQYENLTKDFVKQFETILDFGEETKLLSEYAGQNGIDLELRNEDNELLYDYHQGNYIITNWETTEISSDDVGASVELDGTGEEGNQNISVVCNYMLKDGSKRILTVIVSLQPLNEAKEVMVRIYPVACLISAFFALLFAFIFSKIYIKPIKQISVLTRRMSNLEENVEIPVYSSDEIGELSEDINHLYKELKGTIDVLSVEIDKYSDAENRKIGFLRSVSHELKTPLAATNALIEGIVYEIPPYNTEQKKYLLECKQFLEDAIALVKESLSLSKAEYGEKVTECNVKDLIRDVTEGYMMIIRSKQIEYVEDIPANLSIQTKVGLVKKAISNIISNAVNYTPNYGNIFVHYSDENGILIIENTCNPLSSTELSEMFKPFYSGENENKISNGLGLSIVEQLFSMLHIKYKFIPLENKQGMSFRIYIK